tara:strand:+ start:432 stop:1025 length:594 start_codon:yes stop_codon:yes gene_type:complete
MNDPIAIAQFLTILLLLTHFPKVYIPFTVLTMIVYQMRMSRVKRDIHRKPTMKAKPGDVIVFFKSDLHRFKGDLLDFLCWKCIFTLFAEKPVAHTMVALGDDTYTDVRMDPDKKWARTFTGVGNMRWDPDVAVIPMNLNLRSDQVAALRNGIKSETGVPYWNYGGCHGYVKHILKTHTGLTEFKDYLKREIFLLDDK